jgi:hypothetical protein
MQKRRRKNEKMATKTLNDYPNTYKELENFAEYIIKNYREDLSKNRPGKSYNAIASKNLYNNIETNIDFRGSSFNVSIDLEEYWQYVEDGRRAGGRKPPFKAIYDWITVKRIVGYPMKNGKIPTQTQLAHIIRNAIAKNGIQPTNYLRMEFDDAVKIFKDRITDALVQDFQGMMIKKLEITFMRK